LTDFERPSHYNIHLAARLDAVAGKLYDQVEDICNGVGSKFTADHQGILKARKNPVLMSDSDRSSHTVAVTIGTPDWYGNWQIVENHRDKVGWLNVSGILASASIIQPLLSIAPGNAPSQGGNSAQLDRMLPSTQAQLNGWAGAQYADQNKDKNPFTVNIANMGLVVDPADQYFVRMGLAAASNRRGISFGTQDNFVVDAVDIDRDDRHGYALERWTLNPIVDYVDGVTVIVPSDANGKGFTSQPIPTYTEPPVFDLTLFEDFITDEIDDNYDGLAVAWSDTNPLAITFERVSPFWESIFEPTGETLHTAVPDVFSDRVQNNNGALGIYACTGTALYYCDDATTLEPVFTRKQYYDGTYELARGANGVAGGIGAFGKKSSTNGYYIGALAGIVTMTDLDGTGEWVEGGMSVAVGGDDNKLYGVKMVVNKTTDASRTKRMSAADSGGSLPEMWVNTSDNWHDGEEYIFATEDAYNAVQTGETELTGPAASRGALPHTAAQWCGFQSGFNQVDTTTVEIYPIYYGSQGGNAKFTYSDDYGDSISTQTFGGSNGTPVGDLDDFNLGVVLAAYGGTLEYTDGDYAGVFNAASGASVTPYVHGAIRTPFLKFSDPTQLNNDPTALEFFFAPSSKLDDDSTFWNATLDSTTGIVTSGTDITPSFNGTPYVIADGHGEQFELNPTNPNIILGCFRPHSGGATEILLTKNGGSSWVSKGEYDYNFVRWSTIGNTGAWFAGNAGLAYTPDRGDTIETRNGNFAFIGTVENARGVFPIG